MVIDDSKPSAAAQRFSRSSGCKVILAEDGFDALARSRPPTDVIFVDILCLD